MLEKARKGEAMKKFNTTGICVPSKHYMVDLSERVAEIRKMVDAGNYFMISRARQYGKTTTLTALKKSLEKDCTVVFLDFQGIGRAGFSTEEIFIQEFCRLLWNRSKSLSSMPEHTAGKIRKWKESEAPKARLGELFDTLTDWCGKSDQAIILIIDEVDSAANNQVFLDFLAQLRDGYMARDTDGIVTFQSVILAGVTDVRHLKSKIRNEEQHKVNSPWNIASDFAVDMSLSESGIRGMLDEYEADHLTGMDTAGMAHQIRAYKNGYPFLVSRICQLIDEQIGKSFGSLSKAWTRTGLDEAVKMLLAEDNTLFQSVTGKLTNYPELKASIRSILMEGAKLSYNVQQESIQQMQMYGLIRNDHNTVRVANRIFETMLYNLFLSEEELKSNVFSRAGGLAKNIFVEDGKLNVRKILERFICTYHEVCGPLKDKFREKDGREQFLLYLKPIINGTGNYYIEAQTRDQKRTDVIIDYLGQQYIIELKIWHGERYNTEGEKQITEYLDYFGLSMGYMLSFNFNKEKETGIKPVVIGNKMIYEGTV